MATAKGVPTKQQDAIALLKSDHREVEQLFKAFEKAGERAHKAKRKLVDQMIEALSVHAAIEEAVLYPAARDEVPGTRDEVLEAVEEHHIVKWVLQELQGLDPRAERFQAKVTVLVELVRHHVSEEEKDLFPALRATLGRKRLVELGDELRAVRRHAPTTPHPRAAPPTEDHLLPESVTSAISKARDVVKAARSS